MSFRLSLVGALTLALAACASGPGDLTQPSTGPETLRLTERFYVIGHRGVRGLHPENTLVSFEEAIDLGADVLEMDLHMTADGEIVVYHDPTLNPDITRDSQGKWLRNRGPLIKDLTVAELRTYDVGGIRRGTDYAQQFPRQKSSASARIPTLREVVRLAKSKSGTVKFYLEIKTSPVEPDLTPDPVLVAEAVLDVLRDEDVINRAYLNSADWRPLLHAREIEPRIGLIMTAHVPNHSDNLEMGEAGKSPWLAGFDFDDYGEGYADTSRLIAVAGGQAWSAPKGFFLNDRNAKRSIREAHAGGVSIFVWTVNDEREMRKLILLGVDGIVSDRPDLLRRQAERHAGGKYDQSTLRMLRVPMDQVGRGTQLDAVPPVL